MRGFKWSDESFKYKKKGAGEPEDIINQLKAQIKRFGVKRTLTHLVIQMWASEIVEQEIHSHLDQAGLPAQMYRYGLGLATSIDNETTESSDSVSYFDIISSLRSLSFSLSLEEIEEQPVDKSWPIESVENAVVSAARDKELIVGIQAYDSQYIDAMRRSYIPFQDEFLKNRGLDMYKSVAYSDSLINIFSTRISDTIQAIRQYEIECLRILGSYYIKKDNRDLSIEEFTKTKLFDELKTAEKIAWQHLVETAKNGLWMTKKELVKLVDPMSPYRFDIFIDEISMVVGEGNFASPFDHNPIDEFPLIQYDGEYLVPSTPLFSYALSQRFYYTLRDIEQETNKEIGNKWGNYVEYWTEDCVRKGLPNTNINTNVVYELNENSQKYESDVIIKFGNTLLAIECKSKKLKVSSRSGDYNSIEEDISRGIKKATKQADRIINGLRKNTATIISCNEGEVADFNQVDRYIPIVVVGASYGKIATKEYTRMLPEDLLTPYVVNIYDLEIICEVLDDHDLVEYIDTRIDINKKGYIGSMDEQDYLGSYISGELEKWLPILEAGYAEDEPGLNNGPFAQLRIAGSDHVVQDIIGERFSNNNVKLSWYVQP